MYYYFYIFRFCNIVTLIIGANAIADFLGITRRQVYRLVYDEVIPSFKCGGTVSARKSSLTRWMAEQERVAA